MSEEVEEAGGGGGSPAWMATFGDMMSLLLCFFVLLLSFANMDIIKFNKALGSLRDAFGVEAPETGAFEGRTTQLVSVGDTEKASQVEVDAVAPRASQHQQDEEDEAARRARMEKAQDAQLADAMQQTISENGLAGIVEAVPGDHGVTIRIKGALMFKSGSDDLRLSSEGLLDRIVGLARRFPHRIAVEGHTDRRPIHTPEFPSNWHLSSGRAIAGVLYLIDQGIAPDRLSASGYGATRPIVPETDEASRNRNRRLEFIFYRDDAGKPGPKGEADPMLGGPDPTAQDFLAPDAAGDDS